MFIYRQYRDKMHSLIRSDLSRYTADRLWFPFPPAVLRPLALRRIYTGGLSLGASVSDWDATSASMGFARTPWDIPWDGTALWIAWRRAAATKQHRETAPTRKAIRNDEDSSPSAWLHNHPLDFWYLPPFLSSSRRASPNDAFSGAEARLIAYVAGKSIGFDGHSIFRSMNEGSAALKRVDRCARDQDSSRLWWFGGGDLGKELPPLDSSGKCK